MNKVLSVGISVILGTAILSGCASPAGNSVESATSQSSISEASEMYEEAESFEDTESVASESSYELSETTQVSGTDRAFMKDLKKGLMERWDASTKDMETMSAVDNTQQQITGYCDIELKHIEKYYDDDSFEDKKLEEYAHQYIQSLYDIKDAIIYYNVDYMKAEKEIEEPINTRTLLQFKFLSEYELSFPAKYDDVIASIKTDAKAVEILQDTKEQIKKMTDAFELTMKTETDEYGREIVSYSVNMLNSTELTFTNYGAYLTLLDSSGNIAGDSVVSVPFRWSPGQSLTRDVYFQIDDVSDCTVRFEPNFDVIVTE